MNDLILYTTDDGKSQIQLRADLGTIWRTWQLLATLFQTSRTNVVEHIQHIYEEGELDATATCRGFRQVRTEGTREVAATTEKYLVAQMHEKKQNQWRISRG